MSFYDQTPAHEQYSEPTEHCCSFCGTWLAIEEHADHECADRGIALGGDGSEEGRTCRLSVVGESDEHICDATINPCACGRRWDFFRRYSSGLVTYTTADVVAKYRVLYGEPEVPFQRCEESAK